MLRLATNVPRSRRVVIQCAALTAKRSSARHLSNGTQTPKPSERPEGSPAPRPSINSSAGAATPLNDPPPNLDNVGIPPQNFSKPTLSTLNFWYRFTKFSVIGLAFITGGTLLGFEATHFWVENVELAKPSDPDGELARWGWISEAERWTGGERGGTDPALGMKAAHALRSAWMAQHWGTGASVLSSNALANAQNANAAVEARLEYSHDFLTLALALANERLKDGKPIRPETIIDILARKAATLERIGSKGSLYDARAAYERVWDEQTHLGSGADELARLALKLGDVNSRLGDAEEARSWWARSLQLASDESHLPSTSNAINSSESSLELPDCLPASPHAQRTVAAALSSLSASYAQLGLLSEAKAVQDAGITLLAPSLPSNSLSTPSFSASPQDASEVQQSASEKSNSGSLSGNDIGNASPPQALHNLYLQHRLSLLALHRAEITYALRLAPPTQTLEELAQAAIESEHVVHALSSTSASSKPGEGKKELSSETTKLTKVYAKERVLNTPASSLLRDARRTALYAWTLSGILHENAAAFSSPSSFPSSSSSSSSKDSSESSTSTSKSLWKKIFTSTLPSSSPSTSSSSSPLDENQETEHRAALRCYMRALAWAGIPLSNLDSLDSNSQETKVIVPTSSELLDSEWRVLWGGYMRMKEVVVAAARERYERDKEKEVKNDTKT
ncbi:uncharacterized protein FOMMEDRAFT_166345 [Fomitiporia mediterranea MF3/22]|uniref:uncharacterized protein n=1 Tax=Fomitiporia mediterranea (strain MF3/22) TaxID=694068 RepID=UPI0004408C5F|nr:uncharacterized protein FOMMEDRAFT_166345 [Fomitiporia mediterranea MF3/22]EJD06056.1 hypothetical protein FOMMEDRAFT_166345 [Fomitiporia mediterranea MF3/22]